MSKGGDAMAWLTILAAGLFETGFAVSLKLSHGLTRIWPTVAFAVCALLSFALLTIALRRLEVGAAYAVWTGIGAAGTAVVGMAFLGDAVSTMKLVSIGLILAGVVGLNLAGVTPP
jgi:quaternary ammonium compound-resistance protein SugE